MCKFNGSQNNGNMNKIKQYVYVCRGICSIFVFTEPLKGWYHLDGKRTCLVLSRTNSVPKI